MGLSRSHQSDRREHPRSPVTHTRPNASSLFPPDQGSAVVVRTSSATATPPGSSTPSEDAIPTLALPALEWSGEHTPQPEEISSDFNALARDMLLPASAQSPDMAPGMVLEALIERVARCALLATKVRLSGQNLQLATNGLILTQIYTLVRAQPSPAVTAFLAALASVDLWSGLAEERGGSQVPWFRRPTIQRELVLAVMHFGVLHAWNT